MGIIGIQRYRDLINAVIGGSFYKGKGIVLPYKTVSTQLRLETGDASTKFGVYLNEVFIKEIMSDVNGNVVFDHILPLGEVEVSVINSVSGRRIFTYLTVRDWALWLSAYAEVLETIDDNIQETYDDIAIETSTLNGIEDHFGKAIDVYNNIGQSLDTYRWMVHELRMAYRNTGTRYNGVEMGVAAFAQIPPFGYTRRMWGPNWWLDQSMLINHRFAKRSHDIYDAAPPVNITGVALTKVEADVDSNPVTPHQLNYVQAANTLTWTPDGSAGPAIAAEEGELYLPGPNYTRAAFILGRSVAVTAYTIIAWINNKLYFNIDDIGSIIIQLVTGLPVPTPLQVAGDINTALVADVRYGAGYAAFASVYNGKLLLLCPAVLNSKILIEHGSHNAAAEIFGNDPGDLTFDPYPVAGVQITDFYGLFTVLGNGYFLEYQYDDTVTPPTKKLRWRPVFLFGYGPQVSITQNGTYSLFDTLGNEMRVYCYYDEMPALTGAMPVASAILFSVGFQKVDENVAQMQGLWISVDSANLPIANKSDVIKVYDDEDDGFVETPDEWYIVTPSAFVSSWMELSDVITGKLDDYNPSPAFKWRITDATVNVIEVMGRVDKWPMPRPGPRGRNYPQRSPGLFYDYEGFTAEFGVWIRNYNAAAATAALSFSFDKGGSWVIGTPAAVVTDTGAAGYEDSTFISFSTIIPAGVTDNGVLVALSVSVPLGTVDISIDSPSVGIKYISSRYLGNATVSRHRHKQYFGELMWAWCPDRLTLKEKEYIGLQHKAADKTTVFSGVTITNISLDTSAGVGTMDYEYNSSPDTRRLRWNSFTSAWGVGAGWVSITSTGSYNLAAPDGSFVTVQVSYDVLPVLSGTPPAASDFKSIIITDETINQGTVRKIAPAQSAIDIHDTTEYTSQDIPLNLVGSIKEGDFLFGTRENLEVAAADPFRFSYLYPTLEPVVGETLVVASPAPHLATLAQNSDQDQITAVLYEDGLPVSNDSWQFNAANQIQILTTGLSPFNSSAIYTIDYGLLYQYTTPYIDLGVTTYQDYAWFADYYLWDRMDSVEGNYLTTVPVIFNPDNGRAYLTQQSSMNIATSKLHVQDGIVYRDVPKRYWRFRNNTTIEIESAYLVGNAQYYLEHEEARVYEVSRLTVTFEHRSGTDSTACGLASWVAVERNENVDVHTANHLIHQLRLTIKGIRDLRDFRIRCAILKGLHLHGSFPDVTGLTNVWGT